MSALIFGVAERLHIQDHYFTPGITMHIKMRVTIDTQHTSYLANESPQQAHDTTTHTIYCDTHTTHIRSHFL